MIKLTFTRPDFENQTVDLPDGKTTVGRASTNTLIIRDDTVSAAHCEILVYGREVIIRDQASTNGTWVDNCHVKGQTCVSHGQRIRFGSVEARLELPTPAFGEPDTEVTAIHLLGSVKKDETPQPRQPVVIQPSLRSAA